MRASGKHNFAIEMVYIRFYLISKGMRNNKDALKMAIANIV